MLIYVLACLLEESHDKGSQLHAVAAQLRTLSDLGHQALQDFGGWTCTKWEVRETLVQTLCNNSGY